MKELRRQQSQHLEALLVMLAQHDHTFDTTNEGYDRWRLALNDDATVTIDVGVAWSDLLQANVFGAVASRCARYGARLTLRVDHVSYDADTFETHFEVVIVGQLGTAHFAVDEQMGTAALMAYLQFLGVGGQLARTGFPVHGVTFEEAHDTLSEPRS